MERVHHHGKVYDYGTSHVVIPTDLRDRLRAYAKRHGLKMSFAAGTIIEQGLTKLEKKEEARE
jgi:hypothetical protein